MKFMDFLKFGVAYDPMSLIVILGGLILGGLAGFGFFRARLAERLRKGNSPSDARWEAGAVGAGLGGVLPCAFGAWDFGWFLVVLVIAIAVAFRGRARLLGWMALIVALMVAVICVITGRTYSAGLESEAAPAAALPQAIAPAPVSPAATPSPVTQDPPLAAPSNPR